MAFSNNPLYDTRSTKQIPLAYPIALRPANNLYFPTSATSGQDAGMVNVLPVKDEATGTLEGITRPMIQGIKVGAGAAADSSPLRGFYVWEKIAGDLSNTVLFAVVGPRVYTLQANFYGATAWTLVNTLSTNVNTPVRFTDYIDSTSTKKCILVDGVEGYVFTGSGAGTKIVDADFPNPHVPFPVFIDGYLFLAKKGTGDIYNSDLNNPASWTPGNFISSELYPDDIQALVKVDNYLLAIGTQGSEYFFDAGNPTGTPLAKQDGASLPFGTLLPNSIAANKENVIFLANTNEGQAVLRAIKGFHYSDIDSSFLISALNTRMSSVYVGNATTASQVRGYLLRYNGELFYGFRINGESPTGSGQGLQFNNSYLYSFSAKCWSETQYGSTFVWSDRYSWPVNFTSYTISGSLSTFVAGNMPGAGASFIGTIEECDKTSRLVFDGFDTTGAGTPDVTAAVFQEVRTPNLDFGTMNLKTMSRAGLIVEFGQSTPSVTSQFAFQWNDYDYADAKWTTNITVNYDTADTYFPFITQLGAFRRRAFRISNASGTAIRWKMLELSINKGSF